MLPCASTAMPVGPGPFWTRANWPGPLPVLPALHGVGAVGVELLDAGVGRVDDVEVALRVDGDAARRVELAGGAPLAGAVEQVGGGLTRRRGLGAADALEEHLVGQVAAQVDAVLGDRRLRHRLAVEQIADEALRPAADAAGRERPGVGIALADVAAVERRAQRALAAAGDDHHRRVAGEAARRVDHGARRIRRAGTSRRAGPARGRRRCPGRGRR